MEGSLNTMTRNKTSEFRGFVIDTATTMTTTEMDIEISKHTLENPGDARYFAVFVSFAVFFLGTIGNGLTVWAYARNKNLQTSFNILIANLCIIELFFSAIVIPLNLPGYIVEYNVYGKGFCSVVGYFYYCTLTSALYNLTVIAVNRYSGIVTPDRYQKLFTGKRLSLCIASIWLVPLLLYLPVVIGGAIGWTENTLRCGIRGNVKNLSKAIKWYNLSLNITFQAVPLVLLIILYSAIFRKVKQVQNKMKEHHQSSFRRAASKVSKQLSNASNASNIKNRSGNTSDETGEDFKPSSLIEGIYLRPVQENNLHISNEMCSSIPKETDPATPSVDTSLIPTNADKSTDSYQKSNNAQGPPKKRSSIWQLLIRNSQNFHTKSIPMKEFVPQTPTSMSTDNPWSEDDMLSTPGTPLSQMPTPDIHLRINGDNIREMRRKKSLSAPMLPAFDFTNSEAMRCATESQNSSNFLKVPGSVRKTSDQSSQSSITRSPQQSKSVYTKNKIQQGTPSYDSDPLKTRTSWSVRLKKTTREWASTLSVSVYAESDDENVQSHRKRLGTIARKVQERQQRREEQKRRRARRSSRDHLTDRFMERKERNLRKKHARERQLAYSSLIICITFAICILPSSILHVVQAISNIQVAANVVLIVGCIAWLHSVANPIIYGYLNAQYRREYTRILKSIKNKTTFSDHSVNNLK